MLENFEQKENALESCPNITALVEMYNCIVSWICVIILKAKSVSERAHNIEKIINIMKVSRSNFIVSNFGKVGDFKLKTITIILFLILKHRKKSKFLPVVEALKLDKK